MSQVTMAQLAEMTGKDRKQLRRMIADGRLTPATKLPGKTGPYLFESDEIARVFGIEAAA